MVVAGTQVAGFKSPRGYLSILNSCKLLIIKVVCLCVFLVRFSKKNVLLAGRSEPAECVFKRMKTVADRQESTHSVLNCFLLSSDTKRVL